MTVTTAELRPLLKRLKLGPMLDTLPERIALARRDGLDYADFLQIVLADEVSRRDHGRLELRLRQAGFEQLCRLEDFDWSAQVRLDRRLLDAACSLRFLDRREHVLLVGPVGVGKSFLAQALGYAAVRSGHSVRFVTADQYFRELAQARVDHSTEKAFRSFLAPDLLILDDLGLHRLSAQQSIDLYELIIGRHRSSSFVITSEPRRRGVARPLRRPDPRQQRTRPARQRQLPDRDRGRELPPAALAAPRPARGAGQGKEVIDETDRH